MPCAIFVLALCLLQPVGTIFTLSLFHIPEHQYLPERSFYTYLVPKFLHLMTVFATATQGSPLDHLALEARGACIPGSHGNVTIRDSILGRLPPSGHCTGSRLKHTPSLAEKAAYLLVHSFGLRGRLLIWHIYRGLWRGSRGTKAAEHNLGTLPLPHSSSLVSSRKKSYIPFSGALIFTASARGHLYIA